MRLLQESRPTPKTWRGGIRGRPVEKESEGKKVDILGGVPILNLDRTTTGSRPSVRHYTAGKEKKWPTDQSCIRTRERDPLSKVSKALIPSTQELRRPVQKGAS